MRRTAGMQRQRRPKSKDRPVAEMRVRCSRHIHRVVLMEHGSIALPDHPPEMREAELAAACLGQQTLRCFQVIDAFNTVVSDEDWRWKSRRRRRRYFVLNGRDEKPVIDPRKVLSH